MKNIYIFLFTIFLSNVANAQFLDFNIFRPNVSIASEGVIKNTTDSLSIGIHNHQVSALIPLHKKFDVDLDWGNILKSKGLKDAFKKVINPKFHQVFGRVGMGYRTYESNLFKRPVDVYNFSVGVTGIKLQMKSGKFRFLMYSLNIRLDEQLGKYNTVSPSVSGLIGSAKIFDYRSGLFYGVYANYYSQRIIPVPVIAYYYRLSRQSDILLAFPYQAKYNIGLADNVQLGFTASLNSYINGLYNDTLLPNASDKRLNFQNLNARFSTQARFNLGKKAFFYLEAGWQEFNSYQYFKGYETLKEEKLKGNIFIKGKLSFVLGKSLFNPSVFDFDL